MAAPPVPRIDSVLPNVRKRTALDAIVEASVVWNAYFDGPYKMTVDELAHAVSYDIGHGGHRKLALRKINELTDAGLLLRNGNIVHPTFHSQEIPPPDRSPHVLRRLQRWMASARTKRIRP